MDAFHRIVVTHSKTNQIEREREREEWSNGVKMKKKMKFLRRIG